MHSVKVTLLFTKMAGILRKRDLQPNRELLPHGRVSVSYCATRPVQSQPVPGKPCE